jgi:hypothetical protein
MEVGRRSKLCANQSLNGTGADEIQEVADPCYFKLEFEIQKQELEKFKFVLDYKILPSCFTLHIDSIL